MEQEILNTLQEIRTVIYILVIFVFFGIVVNSVRAAISIKGLLRRELYEQFKEEASQFYDKGDFTSLIDHCIKKLKINPNHTYALWYLAKAYYQKNDFKQAKQVFRKSR
jgi:cytochrome c-type biogenesis protein CcmH/NrfG